MKQVVICSATLALTLFVAPSYGDNWERQKHHQEMMMQNQTQMQSGMGMQNRQANVEQNRRNQLERGSPQNVEDIENLPSTAAGRQGEEGMEYKDDMDDNRDVHRGEKQSEY